MNVSCPSALHCYLCLTHCCPGNVPNLTPGPLMSTPLVNTGQPTLYYYWSATLYYYFYNEGSSALNCNLSNSVPRSPHFVRMLRRLCSAHPTHNYHLQVPLSYSLQSHSRESVFFMDAPAQYLAQNPLTIFVCSQFPSPSIPQLLNRHRVRWLGHVARTPQDRDHHRGTQDRDHHGQTTAACRSHPRVPQACGPPTTVTKGYFDDRVGY